MNAAILTCSNLRDYVDAAQKKLKSDIAVYELDKNLHDTPDKLKAELIKAVETMPEVTDTVLIVMGYCGGAFEDVVLTKKAVICRVDDCVTMMLTRDDIWRDNLKEAGHLYILDNDADFFSAGRIYNECAGRLGEKKARKVMKLMFANYRAVDVIDTGEFDCHTPEFEAKAHFDSELIKKPLNYVKGSNILIEKLLKGEWDGQFITAEAGERITMENFGSNISEERRSLGIKDY